VNLDPEKLMTLFVIALLVIGPQRLPQVARTLGRGLAEVKKYRSMLSNEMNDLLEEPKSALGGALSDVRQVRDAAMGEVRSATEGAVSEVRSAREAALDELRAAAEGAPAEAPPAETWGGRGYGVAPWQDGNGSVLPAESALPGSAPDDPSLN
jgi:Sec-independent protein translocase protein TatA